MKPTGYALVTGASRGIGKHFARALATRSWDVSLVARTQDQLEQFPGELSAAFGVRVETIALDRERRMRVCRETGHQPKRHVIPKTCRVGATSILGGLHHEYRLEKLAS